MEQFKGKLFELQIVAVVLLYKTSEVTGKPQHTGFAIAFLWKQLQRPFRFSEPLPFSTIQLKSVRHFYLFWIKMN